jgi:hypothetical protein
MTGSMKADEAAALSAEDEGYLIEELRSLKSRRSPWRSRVAQAVQILEQTGSLRVRNAAALALADLRASDAKDPLIALVRRPDTKGSRLSGPRSVLTFPAGGSVATSGSSLFGNSSCVA